MIGACATTRNEQDIIGATVRNLLEQGVDRILVADQSTDATPSILAEFSEITVFDVSGEWYEQERWTNTLARWLGEAGCEWIIPFDADEFWLHLDILTDFPPEVNLVAAELWHHRDPNFKYIPAERLPKVAFRWHPDAVLAVGNHSVSLPAPFMSRGLEIRHLQYRSFEHFVSKVRDHSARLPQWQRDRGDGAHLTALAALSDGELAVEWTRRQSQKVEYDPVPVHGSYRIGA